MNNSEHYKYAAATLAERMSNGSTELALDTELYRKINTGLASVGFQDQGGSLSHAVLASTSGFDKKAKAAGTELVELYRYPGGPLVHLLHGSGHCSYDPTRDTVSMPSLYEFISREAFLSRLFHELAHSTGHRMRLRRPNFHLGSFAGVSEYSFEEMVAEYAAAMMLAAESVTTPQLLDYSAAYILHWSRSARPSDRLFTMAEKAAMAAADMVLNIGVNHSTTTTKERK